MKSHHLFSLALVVIFVAYFYKLEPSSSAAKHTTVYYTSTTDGEDSFIVALHKHEAPTGSNSFAPHEVVLVSHMTLDRLSQALRWCRAWRGPMSLALFIRPQDNRDDVMDTVLRHGDDRCLQRHADIHLVERTVGGGDANKTDMMTHYPFNAQRNAALDGVRHGTRWVFLVDVDMVLMPRNESSHAMFSAHLARARSEAPQYLRDGGVFELTVGGEEHRSFSNSRDDGLSVLISRKTDTRGLVFDISSERPPLDPRYVGGVAADGLALFKYTLLAARGHNRTVPFLNMTLMEDATLRDQRRKGVPLSTLLASVLATNTQTLLRERRRWEKVIRRLGVDSSNDEKHTGYYRNLTVSLSAVLNQQPADLWSWPVPTGEATDVDDWVCAAARGAISPHRLQAAVDYACSHVDCGGIQEGGGAVRQHHPPALAHRADWAMHRYMLYAMRRLGESPAKACDFAGAGRLHSRNATAGRWCLPRHGATDSQLEDAIAWLCGDEVLGSEICDLLLNAQDQKKASEGPQLGAAVLFHTYYRLFAYVSIQDHEDACYFDGAAVLVKQNW
eukprot:PhM_4_TR5245/c0_g1_i3/m.54305